MSFNGGGLFLINSAGQPVVSGTTIQSTVFNAFTQDVATGLSTCIAKDGQTTVTADIPLNGHKLTGLAAATSSGDAIRYEQWLANINLHCCELRLTLTTGVPVTTADVTAGTIFFTPYKGNRIALYDGTNWLMYTTAEISVAVPAVATTMYDIFCFSNAGTPALEVLAWTNDTTRATAITRQNGVLVKSGDATRRYVGSFRSGGISLTTDSFAFRNLWNYYNRVARTMRVKEATATWTYTTFTFRQANANALNQLDFVIGVSEDIVTANVIAGATNTNSAIYVNVGIGLDATGALATDCLTTGAHTTAAQISPLAAQIRTYPGIGRHTLVWLERSVATGTTTWEGASNEANGIHGEIWC